MSKLALVVTLCVLASLAIVAVDAHAAESAADEAAYGAGAVLGTVLYAPFKTAFCIGGGVTSALALPFGGTRTASTIATAACGGTWAISPGMVQRREPVRFVGGGAKPLVSANK
jgi:hypothetical protein